VSKLKSTPVPSSGKIFFRAKNFVVDDDMDSLLLGQATSIFSSASGLKLPLVG
jgi:hypothetical protein